MTKWIYTFGGGCAEGRASDIELLGTKGVNLAEMSRIGLPVPPGFTIISKACHYFHDNGKTLPEGLQRSIMAALASLETLTGRKFGDESRPLFLSVRSGSRVSMPGMMDTVLNLGLNDQTVLRMATDWQDERFAFDSYRRFIQIYGDVVMGLDHSVFEEILEEEKARLGRESDIDVTASEWRVIIARYKQILFEETGEPFPQDTSVQLWGAIRAVFSSWMGSRALTYRMLHNIPADWGTALSVQAMVFGNLGDYSGTGIAFTRNPQTGENALCGEFLLKAQGEDVVAPIRPSQSLTEAARLRTGSTTPSLEKLMPDVFDQLTAICHQLEVHYHDMLYLEFTIERGKLWMLQVERAKRGVGVSIKIAVDMVHEKLIDEEEAVDRIDPAQLDALLHPTLDPDTKREVIGTGLAASPGAATGEIFFTSAEALTAQKEGRRVILVRTETSPEDIAGMHSAQGILTTRGGMTSHAAVVARGMGIPCVAGVGSLRIDLANRLLIGRHDTFKEGDTLTIDGSSGHVLKGEVAMLEPELSGDFARLMVWADKIRRMKVRANAETPADARAARAFGAEGIGLCRTEHMFFEGERINSMREMILANEESERHLALMKLLPIQRSDFAGIFEIMHGLPVTIRLLDPPLHEFLPKTEEEVEEVAITLGMQPALLKQRIDALHEFNPMLGHRGCRLHISHPEIVEMQARAIFEAAVEAAQNTGSAVVPEIMVPLVGLKSELDYVKARIDRVAANVMRETGVIIEYLVGTMIELPRAALRAHVIAEVAEFFSYGTNDLTQTTFGMSRDDASSFLPTYQQKGIIERDPFVSLDFDGVGELMGIAAERGRRTRPDLKLGICGEHGGDPKSIAFCEGLNLDYVSCSPFRVPIARLASAQATIRNRISAPSLRPGPS